MNRFIRKIENINYGWLYSRKDCLDFQEVDIPHNNIDLPYNYFNENDLCFESIYMKKIYIDSIRSDELIYINFDGVASYAKVYINEQYVGEHKGGYTGFYFDITEYLKISCENLIKVEVDSRERAEIPPYGNVIDYLTYGGIYREVYLTRINKNNIEDIFVQTSEVLEEEKKLKVNVELSKDDKNQNLKIQLLDLDNSIIKEEIITEVNGKTLSINLKVNNIKLWDLDEPSLYKLKVSLYKEKTIIDEHFVKFGFREAKFKNDGFYLNGKKIKLLGLNRHQSYPYVGYAMPKSMQEKDVLILKNDLGVNVVRTSHYPQSKHFLNKCDEVGLLVFTEIPGWQYIGQGKEWRNLFLTNVKEMILRDRNHPSIILWGVRVNESPDDDELYSKSNNLARKLDPTRQTGGVRNFEGSNFFEDVYTYNDFSHVGNNKGLLPVNRVTKLKDAPYLVTEHNGHMFPTKRFDNEEKRLEHGLRHLRVMDKMYGDERVSGAIGWCMFDYNTHGDFGSGDKICYHGVMDMFRIPKLAFYAYASQGSKKDIMEVSSEMDIGEHPGGIIGPIYVFTNCDSIRFYKNDKYINEFYPNRENFKNLPHPPILIDDFIGDSLEVDEKYSLKDSENIKKVLMSISRYGTDMPIKYKLRMAYAMIKNKLTVKAGIDLYSKYVGDWGGKRTIYKFEGYKNGVLVKKIIKTSVNSPKLVVELERKELCISDTYDVLEIIIKATSEYGSILPYANHVINLEANDVIEIIGEKNIPLIGGVAAVYVKSKNKVGTGKIQISNEQLGKSMLEILVSKN